MPLVFPVANLVKMRESGLASNDWSRVVAVVAVVAVVVVSS